MQNSAISRNQSWKTPETSFDGWGNIWETEDIPYSPHAMLVEYTLVGYWNSDKKGRCNPSIESIMRKTNIKSRTTVIRALKELEDVGRWVIERNIKEHKSSNYYPQFVKYVKKTRKSELQVERMERKKAHELNVKKARETKRANEQGKSLDPFELPDDSQVVDNQVETLSPTLSEARFHDEADFYDATPILSDDPRIKTKKDQAIKDYYLLHREQDDLGEFAKKHTRNVMTTLRVGDVEKKDFLGLNSGQNYVARYPITPVPGTLGAHWVYQYGAHYQHEKFTYSYVSDVYDSLLGDYWTGDEQLLKEKINEVHTAMSVIGYNRKGFSEKVLVAVLTAPVEDLDEKLDFIRAEYEETLRGLKISMDRDEALAYDDQEDERIRLGRNYK